MDYDSDSYFSAEETPSVTSHSEALIEATAAFDLRGVLRILEAGIDPNEPLEDGITALHIAANSEGNKVYVMQALLDYEADPNIQSLEGITPLHVAATWGKLDAIKLLLANNADPRVNDLSGKSPLDCCSEMRHKACALYLREILQGRAIPRSVADVFDEMDFESYHSQLLNQTEELSDHYLPDISDIAPKLNTSKSSKNKRRNRSTPPAGLDSSDEQFLSEISLVLRSNLVADKEYEGHTHRPESTRTPNKPRARKKQQKGHPHQRSHSTPALVASSKKPSKNLLDTAHPGCFEDLQDYAYTREELTRPRNITNDTFELPPDRECLHTARSIDTELSDDVRPASPALANIDLADSDVTLTVFNSDDSEYFAVPTARTQQLIPNLRHRAPEPQEERLPSGGVVRNFVKADELIARNSQNRANLYSANVASRVVKPQNERQGVDSTQVDKATISARIPDKLSDNSKPPMQAMKNSKEPVSILKNKNEGQMDFSSSQPLSYSDAQQLATIGEGRNSPVELSEYRDRAYKYSQEESYIQAPESKKKPIKKKIGEIVSKSKSITSKPKLTINKPNFLKSKETKSTQNSSDDSRIHELKLNYSSNTPSYTPWVQGVQESDRTASAPLHTSVLPESHTSRNSTGTQTIYKTEPQPTLKSDQNNSQKYIATTSQSVNKTTSTTTIKSITEIHALSDQLDRDYMYNANPSSINKNSQNMYPHLSDSPELINTMEQPYSTPACIPDKPPPYTNKRDQDTSTTPNAFLASTLFPADVPNSFTNPYLDTSHTAAHYTQPKPKQRDRTPEPDSSLPTQSQNSFSTLLEEVNRSLPYELKLSDSPSVPVSPITPPPALKHSAVPTPFIQAGLSPTPALPPPSQSLTPRSKRRVTIDPNPTDVQFCDEYDRTPVMPSLDPHISDDSDEAREEIIQELTANPGAQEGGTYVHPPPYQGAPTPYSGQLFPSPSETIDTTFDLDPSIWKDSPTYIGLDDYLQQQSDDDAPSPSSPLPSPPAELLALTDQQLREELLKVGEQPGPITPITRALYMRYLSKVKLDPTLQSSNCFQGYLYELAQVLTGSRPIPSEQQTETDMCQYFDNPPPGCSWREGISKESFNYILIDSRISQNLPSLIAELSELDRFRIFVESIFYVGKGKRSRPYSHLYEAISCERNQTQATPKHQRILDIWASGHGVVSLHCFQGTVAVEAFSREACLIETIGLNKLTNTKKGEVYGVVGEWNISKKRRFGIYLLHRAMHILIAEGERQICRENLTK